MGQDPSRDHVVDTMRITVVHLPEIKMIWLFTKVLYILNAAQMFHNAFSAQRTDRIDVGIERDEQKALKLLVCVPGASIAFDRYTNVTRTTIPGNPDVDIFRIVRIRKYFDNAAYVVGLVAKLRGQIDVIYPTSYQ